MAVVLIAFNHYRLTAVLYFKVRHAAADSDRTAVAFSPCCIAGEQCGENQCDLFHILSLPRGSM